VRGGALELVVGRGRGYRGGCGSGRHRSGMTSLRGAMVLARVIFEG